MFEKFDDTAAEAFINCIKRNKKIIQRIKSPAKLRRLRSLGNIVLERISENFHDKGILIALSDEAMEKEFFEKLKNN
ncbi:hypothetical protein [Halobacillus litoralis]|uniref:hypothetical protein n=1 Tax=Halobacillus litoralis TaxID=45668 RepID=UPI001CFE07E9|nr:hypothetical protein [Halobacillus litoralis]